MRPINKNISRAELLDREAKRSAEELELQTQDVLEHHGVLGMRWGIRRYQPYSIGYQPEGTGGKYVGPKTKPLSAKKAAAVQMSQMTDKELKDVVTRMNLEKQYSKNYIEKHKTLIATGAAIVGAMILSAAKTEAQNYINDKMKKAVAKQTATGVAKGADRKSVV